MSFTLGLIGLTNIDNVSFLTDLTQTYTDLVYTSVCQLIKQVGELFKFVYFRGLVQLTTAITSVQC